MESRSPVARAAASLLPGWRFVEPLPLRGVAHSAPYAIRPDGSTVEYPHTCDTPAAVRPEESGALANLIEAVRDAREILRDRDASLLERDLRVPRRSRVARVARLREVLAALASGTEPDAITVTFDDVLASIEGMRVLPVEEAEPDDAGRWLEARLGPALDAFLTHDPAPPDARAQDALREAWSLARAAEPREPRPDAPLVVCVTAYGIDPVCWETFAAALAPDYRAVPWRCRGVSADESDLRHGVAAHADDLAALLQREGARSAHIVAWCTGAKPALLLAERDPAAVESLVYIAGDFAPLGGLEDVVTDWDDNLLALASLLERFPEAAGRFVSAAAAGTLSATGRSMRVFQVASERYRRIVLAAFDDERTLVNYCRMFTEYRQHDVRAMLGRVDAPSLVIIPADDVIASPEVMRAAAAAMPSASTVELPAETHWVLFEGAREVAMHVRAFLSRVITAAGGRSGGT